MWRWISCALLVGMLSGGVAAEQYPDRFVWVFGWNLGRDSDVPQVRGVLETAGRHGLNGAVVSFGLDTLCKQPAEYFRRLEEVQRACDENKLEMIPAIFSVGYGGSALAHDRNLAEGVGVRDARFEVKGGKGVFVAEGPSPLANGDFEQFTRHRLKGFGFHDEPGVISFVDEQVKHGGRAALRLENFTANRNGHGRVSQEVKVRPGRVYRMSLWVKTENLSPTGSFRMLALAGSRDIAPRTFNIPATGDWRKVSTLVNSLGYEKVRLYAGIWGGKGGKVWLDDWVMEEVGPINVLRRPGTPVTVKGEDGTVYEEGRDYLPLRDPEYRPSNVDREAPALRLAEKGRIREGQRLRVSWYHPMVVHESQVTVCMGEPALYEIYEHEAKLLGERVKPKRVLLNMDEVRMGGTCAACAGKDMAKLLGECISRQAAILRKHIPGVKVYVWSDMLDPHHNARKEYYLVEGDYTGSWKHVPKDLVIAVWGGEPREKNLRFFADEGFETLAACYYDAKDLEEVKGWIRLAKPLPRVRGLMYTPWLKKYELLGEFGDLVREAGRDGG